MRKLPQIPLLVGMLIIAIYAATRLALALHTGTAAESLARESLTAHIALFWVVAIGFAVAVFHAL